jgi:hypothetical protein
VNPEPLTCVPWALDLCPELSLGGGKILENFVALIFLALGALCRPIFLALLALAGEKKKEKVAIVEGSDPACRGSVRG